LQKTEFVLLKVLIIDPFHTGHHINYLFHITEAFLKSGVSEVSAGNINLEYKQRFEYLVKDNPGRFGYVEVSDPHGGYNDRVSPQYTDVVKSRWMAINEVVLAQGDDFDFVFLPWLDSYIDGRIESDFYDTLAFRWVGVYFQPYVVDCTIKDIEKCRFLDPAVLISHHACIGLALLVNMDLVRNSKIFCGKKLYIIPDFADMCFDPPSELITEIVTKKKGRYTVGLYGSLAKRKGILQLLKTAKKYDMFKTYFFIIGGELIIDNFSVKELRYIESVVEQHSDSFFYHPDRLVSEAEFNTLMMQCDVVYAAYVNFYFSSNMLIKAACLRKPIIVTRNTYMGYEVEKYYLGLAISPSQKSIYKAISDLRSSAGSIVDDAMVERYVSLHSLDELVTVTGKIVSDIQLL
jgi:hypothetical protein